MVVWGMVGQVKGSMVREAHRVVQSRSRIRPDTVGPAPRAVWVKK